MEDYITNPSVFVKKNVNHTEYFMQKYAYQLNIVNIPEIIEYDDKGRIMVMKKIGNDNLSNILWVKQFEIMVAGNFKKWKKAYQLALQIEMQKSKEKALH